MDDPRLLGGDQAHLKPRLSHPIPLKASLQLLGGARFNAPPTPLNLYLKRRGARQTLRRISLRLGLRLLLDVASRDLTARSGPLNLSKVNTQLLGAAASSAGSLDGLRRLPVSFGTSLGFWLLLLRLCGCSTSSCFPFGFSLLLRFCH